MADFNLEKLDRPSYLPQVGEFDKYETLRDTLRQIGSQSNKEEIKEEEDPSAE